MSEMLETIKKTREYLDYIEEHYNNVQKVFKFITSKEFQKEGEKKGHYFTYISDDFLYFSLQQMVEGHDLSKLSKEEFVQYREAFYPIPNAEKKGLGNAWEHHKTHNNHHWQNWTKTEDHVPNSTYLKVVHNFIDWFAMSLKFGGKPLDYYRKNKDSIGGLM